MRDERLQPQYRVVTPILSAIALPPCAPDGVGAQTEPHAKLKDAREGAGGRKPYDQALKNAEIGIRLHDSNQAENGIGGHEAVGVERHREIMLAAPAVAKLPNIAGLVACVNDASSVRDRHPIGPPRAQGSETSLLAAYDARIAAVAKNIQRKSFHVATKVKASQHRLQIPNHPLRRFVADAQQNRG